MLVIIEEEPEHFLVFRSKIQRGREDTNNPCSVSKILSGITVKGSQRLMLLRHYSFRRKWNIYKKYIMLMLTKHNLSQ